MTWANWERGNRHLPQLWTDSSDTPWSRGDDLLSSLLWSATSIPDAWRDPIMFLERAFTFVSIRGPIDGDGLEFVSGNPIMLHSIRGLFEKLYPSSINILTSMNWNIIHGLKQTLHILKHRTCDINRSNFGQGDSDFVQGDLDWAMLLGESLVERPPLT